MIILKKKGYGVVQRNHRQSFKSIASTEVKTVKTFLNCLVPVYRTVRGIPSTRQETLDQQLFASPTNKKSTEILLSSVVSDIPT